MLLTAEGMAADAETVLADLHRRMPNAQADEAEVMRVLAPYTVLAETSGQMVRAGEAAETMQGVLVKSVAGMLCLMRHLDGQALAGSIAAEVLQLAQRTARDALAIIPPAGEA